MKHAKFSMVLIVTLLLVSSVIFSEDFYKKFSLGIESKGSIYGLFPFASFFYLKAGYPWSGVGFKKEFEDSFLPILEGEIEFNLNAPISSFLANFFLEMEYQNVGIKSGVEIEFSDFSNEEKGRFYYIIGPYLDISNLKLSLDFRYHFLSTVYDENDSFYYNWPSPVSDDLMSMSSIDFKLSYTLFGDRFGSKVNMRIFGGYKLSLAWSSFLGEALYRPNEFYFGIMFGI